MHSSRMRTIRSRLLGGYLLRGGVWSWGVPALGGVPAPRGVTAPRGAPAPVRVPAPGGGVVSQHALRQTPLWTDRQV